MPLTIVRNDITQMRVDAIVNAANESLLGGGGVDGCIHRAAGPELLEECRALRGCRVGEAKLTRAYRLPCRYVIHTVGPVWHGGRCGEPEQLANCYRASLALAESRGCQSVAFPLISSGAYGYPVADALRVAVDTIGAYLQAGPRADDMNVTLVIFDKSSYRIASGLYDGIRRFIDDVYVDESLSLDSRSASPLTPMQAWAATLPCDADSADGVCGAAPPCDSWDDAPVNAAPPRDSWDDAPVSAAPPRDSWDEADDAPVRAAPPRATPSRAQRLSAARPSGHASDELRRMLEQIDESFTEMLLRKIDESGMTDAECYKRANVDRKLFSKIRGNRLYQPSKPTALAFAIALRLSLNETRELLMKAGYALSRSSKFDVIVEYCIVNHIWNVYQVNEALFQFDQALLGMA